MRLSPKSPTTQNDAAAVIGKQRRCADGVLVRVADSAVRPLPSPRVFCYTRRMRELCYNCLRPRSNCFCRYIEPADTGVKFVFLMHPKEAKRQRTGTGRLAHVGLVGSEILVGADFTAHERLRALLADERYYPMLLYPGDDAVTASNNGFTTRLGGRRLLVIVVDATWFCARKLLEKSDAVRALPKLSFSGDYRSLFTFKREPRPEYISTIESCYYLVKELQAAAVVDARVSVESLMTAFKAMITFQLRKENDRIAGLIPNSHHHDWKYTRRKELPAFAEQSALAVVTDDNASATCPTAQTHR